MDNETHKCTACSCDYTDDEGGIQGCFGMLPMSFCPTCYACIWDMVDQQKEWVGLTYEEVQEILLDPKFQLKPLIAHAVEAKLKEKNT